MLTSNSNPKEIKFSVIVPAYNAEKYLERCLTSLVAQDLPAEEYEIIVINDGSQDNTEKILQQWAERHSNLRQVTTANQGVSAARNRGCDMARGKYLLFADADDRIQPNVLHRIYEVLEKDELDILVMDYKDWGEHGELPRKMNYAVQAADIASQTKRGCEFMQKCLPQVIWCNAYRTSFWKEHRFTFLPIRHEDEEIIPRLFYRAERVAYHPILFYFYHENPDSFMNNYDVRACFFLIQAMESLDAFRKEHVTGESNNSFFRDLIAKRILVAFRNGIRQGMSNAQLKEMIKELKAKGLLPLPKGKQGMHSLLFWHAPSLYIAYYKRKTRPA